MCEGGALSAALARCLPRQRAELRPGMKAVRVRLRVTARGCVAVTMRALGAAPPRIVGGSAFWEHELCKSRLRAIQKAVKAVEIAETKKQQTVGSDSDSWFSCTSGDEG